MSSSESELGSEFIRGRLFTKKEITLIKTIVEKLFERGRTAASIEVCEILDWRQPNGWLKDRACRDVLRVLESKGYLVLPKLKSNPIGNKNRLATLSNREPELDSEPIFGLDLGAISLGLAKGSADEGLWNYLVNKYHYLGFNVAVGRTLKYLVRAQGRVVAGLCFADPAWSLQARNQALAPLGLSENELRRSVINNNRFIILPWVSVPNLGSRILSLAIKRVSIDWLNYYASEPLAIETFVDTSRFTGAVYKAANWRCLGTTKGYMKSGKIHKNSQAKKAIFVYPLSKAVRVAIEDFVEEVAVDIPIRKSRQGTV